MQTFLPFKNFEKSARILDSRRLNKQIVEGFQILEDRVPNKNHPICLFWGENKKSLKDYILIFCEEYERRFNKIHSIFYKIKNNEYKDNKVLIIPELMILSHKVNLLRKDYNFYNNKIELKYDLNKYPLGYYWPVSKGIKSRKDSEGWLKFKI